MANFEPGENPCPTEHKKSWETISQITIHNFDTTQNSYFKPTLPPQTPERGWSESALGCPVVCGFLTSYRKNFTMGVQVILRVELLKLASSILGLSLFHCPQL